MELLIVACIAFICGILFTVGTCVFGAVLGEVAYHMSTRITSQLKK